MKICKEWGKEKVKCRRKGKEERGIKKGNNTEKVIISARGFAVARTTNKAEPVGLCAQTKG